MKPVEPYVEEGCSEWVWEKKDTYTDDITEEDAQRGYNREPLQGMGRNNRRLVNRRVSGKDKSSGFKD